MDVALLQMSKPRVQHTKQSEAVKTTDSSSSNSFDKVFNEAVTKQPVEQKQPVDGENMQAEAVVEEVTEVAEVENLQELFDVLGIEYDESMLFVELNGELIAVDQLLNLEDISELLGMTAEQLQQMISKLTQGEVQVTDIWSLLEQAPELLAHVMATLNGEANAVTPKEAGQVVNVLKLATLLGQKTDTVYSQEVKLGDTKTALQTFVTQLQQTLNQTEQPKAQAVPTFAKVVEQIVQAQPKPEVSTTNAETQPVSTQSQQNAVPTKTVTIALPTDRSQQSEALVKEIQNLINRSQIANNGGTIKLMLKLFPENLGQIRIEIMQQDGVMQTRLLATTAAGKELLDSNLNQLKNAFVAHNIQMERIDIAQSLQNTDQNLRDQGFFNQFFRKQEEEVEEEQKEDDESISFEELLAEQVQAEEV